jgi:hypothetical protein
MAGWKVAIGCLARAVLSFGSQVGLGGADSYVHVGMSVRRKRRQRNDLLGFTEYFGGRDGLGLRMAEVPLSSSLCLPVVTIGRGKPGR